MAPTPSQLTTGLVIKSVTTSPTLAGERMLFILQVSILSEQTALKHVFTDFSTAYKFQILKATEYQQKTGQAHCTRNIILYKPDILIYHRCIQDLEKQGKCCRAVIPIPSYNLPQLLSHRAS